MKNNRKGFTLIELLAVIVILAIIMVIAVPQILNVLDSSKKTAWETNVKLIKEGIELGEATSNSGLSTTSFSISNICKEKSVTSINNALSSVADISDDDMTITCEGEGKVKVTPTSAGQFKSQTPATITCTNGNCSIAYDNN